MNIEDLFVLVVPFSAFALPATCAFFLGKNKSRAGMTALALAWAGFTAWLFFGMQQASGYDGLAYALALVGMSAPIGAGVLIGGSIGWFKGDGSING